MTALTIVQVCQEHFICIDCTSFIQYDNHLGICDNSGCDHYAHCLAHTHPACDTFMPLLESELDKIFSKALDNQRVV